MAQLSLRSLLEVGAHFGHKKERSHPATKRFVYAVKDGILVINVEKTVEYLEEALKFLRKVKESGGTILFVGTKPQAKEALKNTATELGMPYVSRRWLGGTLTNFETVKKSLFQLEQLEKKINDPDFSKLTKRERSHLTERRTKLTEVFEGILSLSKMPDAVFVVDAAHEDIAVAEANRLGIPVAGIMDTNANPDLVDFPIPANDESKRAIELILSFITEDLKSVKVKAKPEVAKEGGGERGKEEISEVEKKGKRERVKPGKVAKKSIPQKRVSSRSKK